MSLVGRMTVIQSLHQRLQMDFETEGQLMVSGSAGQGWHTLAKCIARYDADLNA